MSINNPPGAVSHGKPPTVWIVGGALALASIAAAATLVLRPSAVHAPEPVAISSPKAVDVDRPGTQPAAQSTVPRQAKASAVCGHCGVVESVVAIKRKGEATGLGVVAGGVLGAVVGHQMGNGNGKKAMTVLGAVGGGVAGNEVEKRARGETVYQVHVRMDDNTERTLEQATAPHVGARVEVQGSTMKALRTAG